MVSVATTNNATGKLCRAASGNASRNGGQNQIENREIDSPTNNQVGSDLNVSSTFVAGTPSVGSIPVSYCDRSYICEERSQFKWNGGTRGPLRGPGTS